MLKPILFLVAGVIAAFALLYTVSAVTSGAVNTVVNSIITGAIIIGAALLTNFFKRRHQQRALTYESDSFERQMADAAQGKVMVDALVVGIALGVAAVIVTTVPPAVPVFTLVIFIAVDFWVRYAILLRSARTAQ
jgi:purine-cytosine permease-like protein